EWTAAFEAAELYIDALRAREVMATLVEQRDSVAEIVAFLAERVREGVAAEADLRKFDTEHTRLISQIARASIAMQSALFRLSTILGEQIGANALRMPPPPTPAWPGPAP